MSAGKMALEKLAAVREIQTGSGTMMVGPIFERDMLSFGRAKSGSRAAEGVLTGAQAAPSKGSRCGVKANSLVAASRPQESSLGGVKKVGVKSGPFVYGTASYVIETEDMSTKYWVRLLNSSTRRDEWFQLV